MRIGLIDVDMVSRGKCTYPNLALMKIAMFHKLVGDDVSWYDEDAGRYDTVYMARVFNDTYTKDYTQPIHADQVIRGGSGYAIKNENGREVYHKQLDPPLAEHFEQMLPDYSIYEEHGITNTAYGFLTRGCPRGCDFCHVKDMQGRCVQTVHRLDDFWRGQKNISLLDPNLTASRDYDMHMTDLINSGASVDFSQGLDIRMMTPHKFELLNQVKWKRIHFAWDNPKDDLAGKFEMLREYMPKANRHNVSVYCLTNFDSSHEQDRFRVDTLRKLDLQPYIMIYQKDTAPKITRRLQRWCNWPAFCWAMTFDEFLKTYKRG